MANWMEADKLEKNIILCIHKHPLSISEISKEVKRDKSTVSSTVKRLEEQEVLKKSHNYSKDARKVEIQLNKNRVRIEKSYMVYLNHYIIIILGLAITGIIAGIIKNFFFFLGAFPVSLAMFLFLLYEVYIREEKIVIYKNPKLKEKKQRIEAEQETESSFNPKTN